MNRVHAHRCETPGCGTVWIHSDNNAGNAEAHKCPKCGQSQWKKWLVPVGKLPQQQTQQFPIAVVPLESVILIFMYAAIFVYGFIYAVKLYEYFKKGNGNGVAGV